MIPESSSSSPPLRDFLESILLVASDTSRYDSLCIVTDNAKVHAYNDTSTLLCLLHGSSSHQNHHHNHDLNWGHSSVSSTNSSSSTRWDSFSLTSPQQLKACQDIENLCIHAPERLPSLEGIDRFTIDEYPKGKNSSNKEGCGDDSPTSIIPHRLPSIDALEDVVVVAASSSSRPRVQRQRRGGMVGDTLRKAKKWLLDDEDIIESSGCGMKMPQRLPSITDILRKQNASKKGTTRKNNNRTHLAITIASKCDAHMLPTRNEPWSPVASNSVNENDRPKKRLSWPSPTTATIQLESIL